MPHMQVKTSPDGTPENFRRVTSILAAEGINIDGIGPDFQAPHIRTVVDHTQWNAAWTALDRAGLKPTACKAIPVELDNEPGRLEAILEGLARRGYAIESVLVLGSRSDINKVRVSIGVDRGVPSDWETQADALVQELLP
jgi:hypothetical protein